MSNIVIMNGVEYQLFKAPITEELFNQYKFNEGESKPEFTFENPTYATAKWAQCDFTMASYMGYKLFLKNNEVGQLYKVKGMRVKCQ